MKERPILFSAPMVRSLPDGSKTQTRRVVKLPDDLHPHFGGRAPLMLARDDEGIELYLHSRVLARAIRSPYGGPGDRLWVREAWGYRCSSGTSTAGQYMHTIAYRADDARHTYGPMPMDGLGLPKWRERDEGMPWEAWNARMTAYWQQWRPSMFMPRWASRITLEITDVRVERLQDISEQDAIAEGIAYSDRFEGYCIGDCLHFHAADPRQSYFGLWESINGPGSVEANPWVWAVSFKRLQP